MNQAQIDLVARAMRCGNSEAQQFLLRLRDLGGAPPGGETYREEDWLEALKSFGVDPEEWSHYRPVLIPDYLPTDAASASNPGIPVSLNADTPTAELQLYFQNGGIVLDVNFFVQGSALLPAGYPTPGFGSVDILDNVFLSVQSSGGDNVYSDKPVPLSGWLKREYDPWYRKIPWLSPTSTLGLTFTIIPPGFTGTTPPYVDYVGQVGVSFSMLSKTKQGRR